MACQLVVHPVVREWLSGLAQADRRAAALTTQALRHVVDGDGPEERRPLVDRIKGSRIRALKELRPATAGHPEVRILFVFDPAHRMVLLVAGSRASNWRQWHREAVPLAEARYREYEEHGGTDHG